MKFDLCDPLKDKSILVAALQYSLASLAVSNYPYAVDFLGNSLPGNPVDVSCNFTSGITSGIDALRAVVSLVWKTDSACVSLLNSPFAYYAGFIPGAWSFQRCSEIVIPVNVSTDNAALLSCEEFPPNCWSVKEFSQYCENFQSTSPVVDAMQMQYGSSEFQIKRGDKTFFTNGKKDPWSYAGIPPSENSFWMEGAAHHLDLRVPNKLDPPDVKIGREKVKAFLRKAMNQ